MRLYRPCLLWGDESIQGELDPRSSASTIQTGLDPVSRPEEGGHRPRSSRKLDYWPEAPTRRGSGEEDANRPIIIIDWVAYAVRSVNLARQACGWSRRGHVGVGDLGVGFADHAVAAVALGGVEAGVGASDERLRGIVLAEQRDAHRNGDAAEVLAGRAFH